MNRLYFAIIKQTGHIVFFTKNAIVNYQQMDSKKSFKPICLKWQSH